MRDTELNRLQGFHFLPTGNRYRVTRCMGFLFFEYSYNEITKEGYTKAYEEKYNDNDDGWKKINRMINKLSHKH